MYLSEIPKYINCIKIYNIKKKKYQFKYLSTSSKYIKKNSILFVNKNPKFKKEYIYEAIEKGAVAIITNNYFKNINIPQFVVKDINYSLRKLLKILKNFGPRNMIGITGTNGKTSVVWNIRNIANLNKRKNKSYGTLGYFNNSRKIRDSFLTTPEYEVIYQEAFSNIYKNNFDFIFEISSHAISKKRINKLPINIAALTNISQDHLDFHKSFENYRNTKFKLFTNHLQEEGFAILNDNILGINNLKRKLKKKNINIITYGKDKSDINIKNTNKRSDLKIYKNLFKLKLLNYNNFELENLKCSIACCLAMGIKKENIIKSIYKINKPTGRMQETINSLEDSKVFIDYAHTPDALKNSLISMTIDEKKPNILFGCGGDRDKSKRILMGKIADRYANKVYVTDDNPRNENAELIRNSIMKGCPRASEISNRSKAIQIAINEIQKSEILIIAGKGHENKQIIKNKKIIFDDVKIAEKFINEKKTKLKLQNSVNRYLFNNYDKLKINSNDIRPGDVFIALKGKKSHGNAYINQAIKNGAKYIITDNKTYFLNKNKLVLHVEDSLNFLKNIAILKRKNYFGKVIGITGSAGKTTVKENLKFLISKLFNVYASIKSYNNFLGVLISLVNLDLKSKFAIFEIGTNNFNEISELTKLIRPQQAIITNILPTHLENFKNLKNIAYEKSDIFNIKFNSEIKLVILPNNNKDENLLFFKAQENKISKIITIGTNNDSNCFINKVSKIEENKYLIYFQFNNHIYKIKTPTNLKFKNYNFLIYYILFKYNNLNLQLFKQWIQCIPNVPGRGLQQNITLDGKKILFIDESYNASPETMKNCIDYFINFNLHENQNKFLILGEMNELGKSAKKYHLEIIKILIKNKIKNVILCGELFKSSLSSIRIKNSYIKYISNEKTIMKYLSNTIHKNDIILIKGSNSTKVNKLANLLLRKKES